MKNSEKERIETEKNSKKEKNRLLTIRKETVFINAKSKERTKVMKRTTIICIAALALAAVCLPKMPEWFDKEFNQDIETYAYTSAQPATENSDMSDGDDTCRGDDDGQQSTTTAKRHSLTRTLRKVCSISNRGYQNLGKNFINVWLVSIIK